MPASLHAVTSYDGVEIRPAVPDDAAPLARLQVEAWEDAYGDLMPASLFEHRRATLENRVDRWTRSELIESRPRRR